MISAAGHSQWRRATRRAPLQMRPPGREIRLEAVEAMRGLAAVLVVLGHVLDDGVHFGFEPAAQVAAWPLWGAGVDVFFLISGFIMIWAFADRFGEAGAPTDFMIRRLARIVPLYWIMTSLTALGLVFAPTLFDRAQYATDHYLLSLVFVPHVSPSGGIWPILGVGWTLNYEMFFYLVFAAALLFRLTTGLSVICMALGVAFVGARLLGPNDIAVLSFLADSILLEFIAGIGLGLLVRQVGLNRTVLIAAAATALLAGAVMEMWVSGERLIRAGPPAFAVLCLALALYPRTTGLFGRCALSIGAASYALYLSHILVINLLKASMLSSVMVADLQRALAFGLYVVLALALSLAAALILYRCVERPIGRVCRRRATPIPDNRSSPPPRASSGMAAVA